MAGAALGLVGTAIAGPIGGAIGALAGGVLQDAVMNAAQHPHGIPKLDSNQVMSSTFGKTVPYVFGETRIGGNLIWSSDLKPHKTKSGKIAQDMGKSATYNYTVDLAVCFCQGEILEYISILADTKVLWYNNKGRYYDSIEFYTGTDDQSASSIISNYLESDTPTYRGFAYIVIKGLQLKHFGMRIPQITAHIKGSVENFSSNVLQTISIPTGFNTIDDDYLNTSNILYPGAMDSDDISLYTGFSFRLGMYNGALSVWASYIASNGSISSYISQFTGSPTSSNPNSYFSASKAKAIPSNGEAVYILNPGASASIINGISYNDSSIVGSGLTGDYIMGAVGSSKMGILMSSDGMTASLVNFLVNPRVIGTVAISEASGYTFLPDASVLLDDGTFRAVYQSPNTYEILCVSLYITDNIDSIKGTVDIIDSNTWIYGNIKKIIPVNNGGNTQFYTKLVVCTENNNRRYLRLLDLTEGDASCSISYKLPNNSSDDPTWLPFSTSPDGGKVYLRGNQTTDGSVDSGGETLGMATAGITEDGFGTWSAGLPLNGLGTIQGSAYAASDSVFLVSTSDYGWQLISLDISSSVSAKFIAEKLCSMSLDSSYYDFSDLYSIVVDGYVISDSQSTRDILSSMSTELGFDFYESDGIITARTRHGDVDVIVPDDALGANSTVGSNNTQSRYTISSKADSDLAKDLLYSFSDSGNNYQHGTTIASVVSDIAYGRTTVQSGISTSYSNASKIAVDCINDLWMQKDKITTNIPLSCGYSICCGDMVELGNSGLVIRITSIEWFNSYFTITGYRSQQRQDYPTQSPDTVTYQEQLSEPSSIELVCYEVPPLDDTSNTDQLYFVCQALTTASDYSGFVGGILYQYDSTRMTWKAIDNLPNAATWGILQSSLPQTHAGNDLIQERCGILDVSINLSSPVGDGWESITNAAIFADNTINAAVIYNPNSTNKPEIIQYREYSINSDGTYTISGILRGRRGTMCQNWDAGSYFILLDQESLTFNIETIETRYIGSKISLLSIVDGQGEVKDNDQSQIILPIDGISIKCLAPSNVIYREMDDGSLYIQWNREARQLYEFLDNTGVGVGSDTDTYVVSIIDASGNIVRSIGTTSSPYQGTSYTYSSTDRKTDIESSKSISISVSQITSRTGAGFSAVSLIPTT